MNTENTTQEIQSEVFPQLFNDDINGISALLMGCYTSNEKLNVKYLFVYKGDCVIIEVIAPNSMEMEIFERISSLLSISDNVKYSIIKNDILFKLYKNLKDV